MSKPSSSANHRAAGWALHPTYCCSIDTTAINQPTQITGSLQQWLLTAWAQKSCEAENKAAYHSVPKLAPATFDLYFCCIRSADITWLNTRIGKQSFSLIPSPRHHPAPIPWGDGTGLLTLWLDLGEPCAFVAGPGSLPLVVGSKTTASIKNPSQE